MMSNTETKKKLSISEYITENIFLLRSMQNQNRNICTFNLSSLMLLKKSEDAAAAVLSLAFLGKLAMVLNL
jgi:predicted ATPase